MEAAAATFNLTDHQRNRIRTLELQNAGLTRHRDQLERVILLMLHRWFHDTGVDGMEYLRAVVEIDLSLTELGL